MTGPDGLAAIAPAHSRILILGSFPGVRSLAERCYYAHPRNRFWPLLARLCAAEIPEDQQARAALLDRAGIALWDVLQSAERHGSLDQRIRNPVPNPVAVLAAGLPMLEAIAFNGRAAWALGAHLHHLPYRMFPLPSTSPANAARSLDDLADAWRVVAPFIRPN
jgi:hypoxanthine-DNA glycosylase